ncbi:TonB-dependent hemoglobin/transferrin/lactoferrin family receptor [Aquibium carbonis]|uniref:TonB-dependent hemoglobin/transferrin/lactoferrin family receptor n=1 Tax=Aquibium carbonis TaxID=2495581 RepID=A0A429Z3T6_9HYPH|nr:TonB-dependent hemoglobin/transferrin/lactoferrin family receptor [Aquibium carbonis]RST88391.1 TonB-dependent hemoglobin/transferrin/lactoferrin family receptor [Aquibium carbonis]
MGLLSRNATRLLGSAALCAAAAVGIAHAQDTTDTQADAAAQKQGRVTTLQRLILGAGVEKVAIDTPQSVTVVEQEDIDELQPQTIGDVLRSVPGVNVTGSDRLLGQSFNIRGIGAPETTGDGGRIIINVDGVQKFYEQYRMGSFFSDPELYKRVEVLRGPASSTLYGSGALGGVINFETKDASDFIAEGETTAVRLKSSWSSNGNSWLFSPTFAQRFANGADLLISGNYRQADVYSDGAGNDVIGTNFEAWSGLIKSTFLVGEEGKVSASYQRWNSDLDDQQLSQTSTAAFFGLVDRHVLDQTAIVSYENPFSDNDMLDVKVSASYSSTSNEQRNADLRSSCGLSTSFAIVCDSDYAYDTWQFNAQNTMRWSGANWENFLTVGSQTTYQSRVAEAWLNNGTLLPVSFHPEGTDLKTGVFVQNEFIWNEKLTLIPGVRLDWHRLSPGDGLAYGSPPTPITDDTTDTAISPKIAAHYRFNDTIAVFGSIAHTERFPTIDEIFSTSSSSSTFNPSLSLEKEKSNNYEAGFALSGYDMIQAGDAAQVKVTGFYNDVSNLIALRTGMASGYNNVEGYRNIANAEIYGFEIESAYDSDFVFANAAYSYVVGKDTDANAYLTTIAPHELAFTLGGKLPQHGLKIGWRARIVADPQDEARRTDAPIGTSTRYAQAFDIHDVFLSWKPDEGQMKGWELNAGVDNVFDQDYKEFLNNDRAIGRTFKLSLAKQIGW